MASGSDCRKQSRGTRGTFQLIFCNEAVMLEDMMQLFYRLCIFLE